MNKQTNKPLLKKENHSPVHPLYEPTMENFTSTSWPGKVQTHPCCLDTSDILALQKDPDILCKGNQVSSVSNYSWHILMFRFLVLKTKICLTGNSKASKKSTYDKLVSTTVTGLVLLLMHLNSALNRKLEYKQISLSYIQQFNQLDLKKSRQSDALLTPDISTHFVFLSGIAAKIKTTKPYNYILSRATAW